MTSKNLILDVPFPPSVNTYWQFNSSRRFLTKKATQFKDKVKVEYLSANHPGFGTQRLMVRIELYPPDRRVRDIDNYAKSLIDALCQAKIFVDDEQIDLLTIVRKKQKLGGCCKVAIGTLQNDQ